MADYHFVYKDVEGTSTQWDDIQRKLGNLPEKAPAFKPPAYTPEQDESSALKDQAWFDKKTEDELEDLEDDKDLDDDRFLEEYRFMKKKMSDLPRDIEEEVLCRTPLTSLGLPREIEEEVLCRIPLTSLGLVRSTCKRWNMLSRSDHFFANKHLSHLAEAAKDQPLVVMTMGHRVELMRLNLSNNKEEEEDVVVLKPEAKLTGLDQIDVCEIFHCDGLVLCIPKEIFLRDHPCSRLLVLNPYWGRQPRWIEHTHNRHLLDKHLFGRLDKYTYGFGYDSSTSSHKILRFIDRAPKFVEFKIYDFNSDSWRIIELLPRDNWIIKFGERGQSLKGNTYWFAAENWFDGASSIVCFDFTRETFSPPFPLPFEVFPEDCASLSSSSSVVGGEYQHQLVVLFHSAGMQMEIWISNPIEQPNALSWNSKVFLSANIRQLIDPTWQFCPQVCFFIDQEKKAAVVFDKEVHMDARPREIAYIFERGVDGSYSLKQQVVKEPFFVSSDVKKPTLLHFRSRLCYYVPSLVQLN